MAGIRERKYKANGVTKSYYEISWYHNGKQYKKGGFTSKIDAQLALSSVVSDTSTDIKFGVLAQNYIDRHCTLNCKDSTKTLYQNYLNVNLAELKPMLAKNIKKKDIEYLVLKLKNKGITNKTINDHITFVNAVLNYGVDNELLKENPVIRFKKLPQVKPPIHFLNETQLRVFLELAKNNKFYALFAVAVYTGMRRGEILGLEWSDIDFHRKRIMVNKQIYKGVKVSTKTNKARVVDVPDVLLDILREYKENSTLLCKLVFHNGFGLPVHPFNMENRYFHPLIKECNKYLDEDNQIEHLRFHDLRHTFATLLISKNVPVKFVQEQLGHSSAKMTLDVYASVMPSVKFEAINILQNLQKNDKKEHKKNIEN